MFSRKIIFSVISVVLLSASAQVSASFVAREIAKKYAQSASAMLGRVAKNTARFVGFSTGWALGVVGIGAATGMNYLPRTSENYSHLSTKSLKEEQVALQAKVSAPGLIRPEYRYAPALASAAGMIVALSTRGMVSPAVIGLATGAVPAQVSLDQKTMFSFVQNKHKLNIINTELAKRPEPTEPEVTSNTDDNNK